MSSWPRQCENRQPLHNRYERLLSYFTIDLSQVASTRCTRVIYFLGQRSIARDCRVSTNLQHVRACCSQEHGETSHIVVGLMHFHNSRAVHQQITVYKLEFTFLFAIPPIECGIFTESHHNHVARESVPNIHQGPLRPRASVTDNNGN